MADTQVIETKILEVVEEIEKSIKAATSFLVIQEVFRDGSLSAKPKIPAYDIFMGMLLAGMLTYHVKGSDYKFSDVSKEERDKFNNRIALAKAALLANNVSESKRNLTDKEVHDILKQVNIDHYDLSLAT